MIGREERNAVLRVMERGVLSGYRGSAGPWMYGGEEIKALEREWEAYFGVKHAIACNSATSGLWMALAAVGIDICDEVIVTPYSMTCSATIPLQFNATPIFADIEKDYYCLDVKSIERNITEFTKAIIIVDLFGHPYNVEPINALAKKHGIMVIEDAAQAIGATWNGRYAGTFGDIGVWSLNTHKHIQSGEGGIVGTNNDDLAWKMRLAMNHGEAVENDMEPPYHNIAGMNLRMTELSAAVAREQLKKLTAIIGQYQKFSEWFNTDRKTRIPIRPGCTSAFYKFASLDMGSNPNEALFNMKQHYIKPIHRMSIFQNLGYDQDSCPVCDEVERKISLAWLKETV